VIVEERRQEGKRTRERMEEGVTVGSNKMRGEGGEK
jgi:hypothetical protein